MNLSKVRGKFAHRGINLNRPVDLLPPQNYIRATNVRTYTDGQIEQRPGLALLYDIDALATSRCHSIKRLNDPVNNRSAYFTGAGTKLYADDAAHTAATEIDSGYSGDPLSFVVHRPDQSPLPFVYLADRLRMRKAKSTAAGDTFKSFPIGISPPLTPPVVSLNGPLLKVIDDFEAVGAWTNGGDAGAPGLLAGKRVDTTITYILFDSGTTGFACINPATLSAQLQAGMRLVIDSGGTPETVKVEDIFPAITSTTISSIQYDSGTTGECTIVLTAPSAALRKDSMVRLATAENVRVLSVTTGPVGVTSFRCVTTGTRAAGNTVDGLASFRAYCTLNHAATNTLTDEAVETTITFATGTGYLNLVAAKDLSISSTRPVTNDDYMVINLRVSSAASITEIKVQLDVADATNDFTKDFYTKVFRADDLTASIKGTTPTLTVEQRAVQRAQIDAARQPFLDHVRQIQDPERVIFDGRDLPGVAPLPDDPPDPTQLGLGDNVWTTLRCKIGDLTRVGEDVSRNLKNVAALRITVICTASVVLDVDSWYIEGGYGLDIQGGKWAYRYRSLETKARSNLSPPTRSPLDVSRGSVSVVCATKDTTVSGDPQVTAIDIYRFDDVLEDWFLVGTASNPTNAAATTASFTDEFSDEFVKDNPLSELDQFQPWPIPDLPRSGTCDVKGTEVTQLTGDTFNTAWGRGSKPLKINGTPCTLYTSPSSTTKLSLNENLGTLSSVKWELSEPLLLGQPKALLWGPYGGGSSGIFFFSVDGGTLLWTNANNPDAASDRNRLEITSPSEPLVNGFMYDGRPYVFSSERLFAVYPNFGGVSDFVAQEVANTQGLYAQWGLDVAEGGLIYYVGRDGVYESEGGESKLITTDIYPLFPHDGLPGADGEYAAPDFSLPDYLRLNVIDNRLRLIYSLSSGTVLRSFVWNAALRFWESNDLFTPYASVFYTEEGSEVHGELMGSIDGKLYHVSGTTDAGTAISSELATGALDGGTNNKKLFHDLQVDLDTNSANVSLTIATNSLSVPVTATPSTLTNAARAPVLVNLEAGAGKDGRNLGFALTWNGTGIVLYEYILSYIIRPTDALSWLIPEVTYANHGFFFIKEVWLAYNSNDDLRLKVYLDGVETNPSGGYTLPDSNGAYAKERVILQAAKCKAVKFLLTGMSGAQVFVEDTEALVKQWGSSEGYQLQRPLLEPQFAGGN